MQQFMQTCLTEGRSLINITESVMQCVTKSSLEIGLCHIFLKHTSASLILCENADTAVQTDLEQFMQNLVIDGDVKYRHTAEGPDDMASHIRSVLTTNFLTIPVREKKLALGTWQGIYLWEHRFDAHKREYIVSIW